MCHENQYLPFEWSLVVPLEVLDGGRWLLMGMGIGLVSVVFGSESVMVGSVGGFCIVVFGCVYVEVKSVDGLVGKIVEEIEGVGRIDGIGSCENTVTLKVDWKIYLKSESSDHFK
ncbi:hypothetical protein Tco_0947436 [Tanacetum coccineum]